MPAFPPGDLVVLDNFNRADGAVYADAGATTWSPFFWDGSPSQLVIVDNAVTSSGGNGGMTLASFEDDLFILPVRSTESYLAFLWRIQSPGTGSAQAYGFVASGTTWTLRKYSAPGVFTVLDSVDVESSPSALDRFGVKFVGDQHEIYLYRTGAWNQTPILTATDASYAAAGPVAIWPGNGTVKIEEFVRGSLDVPTEGVTIHVDPDHPASDDNRTRLQATDPDTPFRTAQAACFVARSGGTIGVDAWRDTVLVEICETAVLDATLRDPHMQPQLDHRWTDRSDAVVGWPFGNNAGNLPILVKGNCTITDQNDLLIDGVTMPKILRRMSRGLNNWEFENIQFGYDGDDAYSTLGSFERNTDTRYYHCRFTGGVGIAANWANAFDINDCVIYAPLPPDGGNPGFHDGAGLRMEQISNDTAAEWSIGQLNTDGTWFIDIRGDDALTVGGVVIDTIHDDLYDVFDWETNNCLFYNVTEGANPAFHTDAIQPLAVPRCKVRNSVFVGNSNAMVASDGRNGIVTFENNLVVGAGSPFQMQGTDELIFRHNTFFHTTPLIDASLLFYSRAAIPAKTKVTMVNNIIGGFYMRDADGVGTEAKIEDYFHPDSVIENNIIQSRPGMVTAFGTNLSGVAEFGYSPRMDDIPNVVYAFPGDPNPPSVVLARTWELANSPTNSPGIGQGVVTDITHDRLGRVYANPPDVGCHQSDPGTPVTPIGRAPYVFNRTPAPGSTDAPGANAITADLYPVPGEEIDATTITTTSCAAFDPSGTKVPVTSVTLSAPDENGYQRVTITPAGALRQFVAFNARLTTAIADEAGNHLTANDQWSFTTAGLSPFEPGGETPGGWSIGYIA